MKNKIIITFVTIMAASACAAYEPTAPSVSEIKTQREAGFEKRLKLLLRKDPIADGDAAVRSGNPHLLVFYTGRSNRVSIPGLSASQQWATKGKCKRVVEEGLGDIIYGDNHVKYRRAFIKYATLFNQITARACL